MKRRVLHMLSLRKSHPSTQVTKQPPDQYIRDFDSRVALMYDGEIYVMYEAESGRQMPIPIP